jgi:hypothetical protein
MRLTILLLAALLMGCERLLIDKETAPIEEGKPYTFSNEYIRANQGQISYQVPEVYELVHIAAALTPTGQRNCFIETSTAYYKSVMAQFGTHRNHPLVAHLEQVLAQDRNNYTALSDAAGYVFDGDQISHGGVYRTYRLNTPARFGNYRAMAEDFARVSGFRAFFRQQQAYYQEAIRRYQTVVSLKPMQQWLEAQFPVRYNSYQVVFSPLMGCYHYTSNGQDNGFSEARMFVPLLGDVATPLPIGAATNWQRTVFTEIDHNYVNLITARYQNQLNRAMPNWRVWNTNTQDYGSAFLTFNEYMTWGAFTLYCYDTLPATTFAEVQTDRNWVDPFMVSRRFSRFPAFNAELLRLYKTRKPGQTVADLYPAILDWMAAQP